ncbi:MAG: ArnT family glycosyltransferase [bacterium]
MVLSITFNSVTVDESGHIPIALAQLHTGKFNMNPENPPLVRLWSALPLLFLSPRLHLEPGFQNIDYVFYARQFMVDNQVNYHFLFIISRVMITLLLIPLGITIWRWMKKDYGITAIILALFLLLLNPNIIAHATLSTLDFGLTVLFFASVYTLKRWTENPNWKYTGIAGIVLGLAQCAKFTAVLLYPLFIFAIIWLGYKSSSISKRKLILMAIGILLISILVINIVYCFQLSGMQLRYFEFHSAPLKMLKSIFPAFLPIPYPFFYIVGLDNQIAESGSYDNYLNGVLSTHGCWYYYLFAFLIKNPIPFLICIFMGCYIYFKRTKINQVDWFLILPPILILLFFSLSTTKNIGLRFILPAYPFIAILAAQIINIHVPKKQIILGMLGLWYLISCLWITPNYLAYFNELVNGPSQGYKYLLDSNLDWGQDLIRFKKYLVKHHIESIPFSHFGPVNPAVYGINALPLTNQPQSGLIAISVNNLYGISLVDKTEFAWLREYQPIDKAGYSIFIYDITTTKQIE